MQVERVMEGQRWGPGQHTLSTVTTHTHTHPAALPPPPWLPDRAHAAKAKEREKGENLTTSRERDWLSGLAP